ncbi:MAG: acyl-carrier-protein S-malonyltransferase [Comamonadaceae bacterium]|nr:MAG: acyl-carrier-protein S-malonyltransferase [Comamonadaceae bacterium]
MSYALLFSGQASQHPTMLPWLETEPAAVEILRLMSDRLGLDWRSQLRNADRRSDNAFAQVLITGTALAAWAALQGQLSERPAVVAGYSVGELPAFACAGVFLPTQALTLAAQRAALMDRSVMGLKTGLLSVAGLSQAAVLEACNGLHLECAIRIHASQGLFAGTDDALKQAAQLLIEFGAVCKRLEVQVASHSSWMRPAELAFSDCLDKVPFATPTCPIALNALGVLSRKPMELRSALSQQIASTVQWSDCLDAVAERQVSCVLEIGAGSALGRMWRERYPHIPSRSMDEFQQLHGVVDWIERSSAT